MNSTSKRESPAVASAMKLDTLAEQPTEEWDIARLRPHPRQDELIGSYTQQEIDELAEDIRVNGLRHRLEVHPDGYLIAGHRRKAAIEKLGWPRAPVVIRKDLAKKGETAIELHLIGDNLMRTHYHPIKIARLYQRLKKRESKRAGRNYTVLGDVRDELAKRFNKSGRTLDRYAAVLKAPLAVQEAVERDELSMGEGEAIGKLKYRDRKAIGDRIAAGTPVREAIAPYVQKPKRAVPGGEANEAECAVEEQRVATWALWPIRQPPRLRRVCPSARSLSDGTLREGG